jgi:hypothetical protein
MQILSNEKMIKFTNIDKEDFIGLLDIPGSSKFVQKTDDKGLPKVDSKNRPFMTKVPTQFLIKTGETVLLEESKAQLFCKHLVNKLLLKANAPDWTDESLRKPLVAEVLNQEVNEEEKVEVDVKSEGRAEDIPGKPRVNPVIEVKRGRKPKVQSEKVEEKVEEKKVE